MRPNTLPALLEHTSERDQSGVSVPRALPTGAASIPEQIHESFRSVFAEYARLPFGEMNDVFGVVAVATHCFQQFRTFPQILFVGAKGSGKTRCLELFEQLSANPIRVVSMTPATLFRMVQSSSPTLLVDEATRLASGSGEVAEIFKVGYKRGAKVPRVDPRTREVVYYDVYGPKILACTDEFDHIVADRSITLLMRRAEDRVPDVDGRLEERCRHLVTMCRAYIDDHREAIDHAIADEANRCQLKGRDRELWMPLLAMATLLGGDALRSRVDAARQRLRAVKAANEAEMNPECALLVALQRHLSDHDAIVDKQGKDTGWYSSDALLTMVKRESAVRINQKTGLTQALLRLGVIESGRDFKTYLRLDPTQQCLDPDGKQYQVYRLERSRVDSALSTYLDDGDNLDVSVGDEE